MRVPFNGYTTTLTNQLGRLNFQQVDLQRQLSSGQRATEVHDDPAAVGRALNSTSEKARIQTQARNLNRAELIAQFSSETLEQMKVVVDRARLDANQTDGLTSSADYRARALQTDQQIEQVLRVANAEISGDYLFAGANSGQAPFVAYRYKAGDVMLDENGQPVHTLGATIAAVAATNVTFINAAGELVDSETGEATTNPATLASTLGGTPNFAIEWTGHNAGRLKEWNGADYSADALNGGVPYGDVTIASNAGGDFVAQVSTITVTEDMVGRVSYIEYTGSTAAADDIEFRVGEGATISPFSRGQANANYLKFFNNLVALRDAYAQELLATPNEGVTYETEANSVKELTPEFDGHQEGILLGIVDFGSLLQGVEVTARVNENRFNELENLSSREMDIDIAETIMKLNRAKTTYEAALRSGATVMQLSLLDFVN